MLLNATVTVNGKRLCSQVDFMCVIIVHQSWPMMFGSFSHCCNMNNPYNPIKSKALLFY